MKVKGYYYTENGQAYVLSADAFKKVQLSVIRGEPVDTGGHTLYPIFDEPSAQDINKGKTKIPAWLIRDGKLPSMRWYWQIQEHKRSDTHCKRLDGGLCGIKVVRCAEWDGTSKKWVLLPMVNHADTAQEKVLEAN